MRRARESQSADPSSRRCRSAWQAVLDRKIDWIVSDHACCSAEQKWSKDDPTDIWLAKAGFGGTEYLLSGVLSEGSKRGMSYNHMAELLSWKPAQRFGLLGKGDIAPGYDADIALVDPHESFVVHAAEFGIQAGLFTLRGTATYRPSEEHSSCVAFRSIMMGRSLERRAVNTYGGRSPPNC